VKWWKNAEPPGVLPSERGLLELAARKADMPLRDMLVCFRDLVSADMDWVDSRKKRFRTRASGVRIAALALTAASTVVLGIRWDPGRQTSIALPMVALVTMLGALESFFNWRSRWVLMEESLYRLNRLRDEMDYYLVATPTDALENTKFAEYFQEQQVIWADVSRRWVEFRKLDAGPGQPSQPPTTMAS
jgi:hypothetical protein